MVRLSGDAGCTLIWKDRVIDIQEVRVVEMRPPAKTPASMHPFQRRTRLPLWTTGGIHAGEAKYPSSFYDGFINRGLRFDIDELCGSCREPHFAGTYPAFVS